MRIAFVYDALYPEVRGGGERRVHEIARRLAARHEVTHITWQWWDGPSSVERDGVTLRGVGRPPALYGHDGKRTVREAAAFAARIAPVLARGGWDVVECSATPYLPLYTAWAATRLTRTPMVATWHEFWGDHWLEYLPHRPIVARAARALEAGARPLGDAIVAGSPFTIRRMGRSPSDRRHVVPNGVEEGERPVVERLVDVAYVGRLIDEKRVDLLIDAVARLRDSGRVVRCVIAGDGPAREGLTRHAALAGVSDLVELPGRITDERRAELLGGSRLFAMPSVREGFGITVLEAQAAGAVPVVVRGPNTAASDLVTDRVDGRICEPSAEAIAAAVADLLDDGAQRDRMSLAAREAAGRCEWEAISGRMEEIYQGLLEPHSTLVEAT
jgi:glycosyltransferase involved in cell wall biosynthesis